MAHTEDASRLQFGPEFQNAKFMTNEQAKFLITSLMSEQKFGADTLANPGFKASVEYLKKFCSIEDEAELNTVEAAVAHFKAEFHLQEFEIAILQNNMIGDVEEAFTLVPTLREKIGEEDLSRFLTDLRTNVR